MSNTYAIAAASAAQSEGNSGTTAFTFTVTRTGETTIASAVAWAVTGSGTNAASAADFSGSALPSGNLAFAAGETSKTITVNVAGDTTIESNETFTVTLSNPSEGTIGTASATGTITNDDAGTPSLAIVAANATLAEGQSGTTAFTFTVTRSGDTTSASSASWAVTGSGTNKATASDFSGSTLPSGTVSFAAGETSKTITVNVAGDTSIENNEGFTVTLSNASNATISTASASGTIVDDEGLRAYLSIGTLTPTLAEGDTGSTSFTFTVTRVGWTGSSATVNWAVTGSGSNAATGADFVGEALPSGTLTFAAGETRKTITVSVAGDTTVEKSEGFTVTLSDSAGALINTGSASATITNDDRPVDTVGDTMATAHDVGTISAVPTIMKEWVGSGDAADLYKFAVGKAGNVTVGLTGLSSDATLQILNAGGQVVGISRNGGTADESLTLALAAGIYYARVTAVSGDGDYVVSFTGPTPDPTTLAIAATRGVVTEGDSGGVNLIYTVTRSGNLLQASTVTWAVDGKTTAPVDAADFGTASLPSGTLSFAVGEASKTIVIRVSGDTTYENDERLRVVLSEASGAEITTASAVGVIRNDDAPDSFLAIAATSANKAEGNAGSTPFTFTVTRSGDASEAASVSWAVSGTTSRPATAADFTGGRFPSGTLSFAAGETSKTITVNVAGDSALENNDRFAVTLSNASGAQITTASATGIILNDDTATGYLAIAATTTEAAEGTGGSTDFVFTVTRTGDASTAASVDWSTAGTTSRPASAADFADGAFPSGTLSFAAGETSKTITIKVAGDSSDELDERFTVTLADAEGAQITTASATAIIRDDDEPAAIFSIAAASADKAEGNSGSTPFTFTVTRTGETGAAGSVAWAVTGSGTNLATAIDFATGSLPSGTVSFKAGETSKVITVNVLADATFENDEGFTVTLSGANGGTIGTASAGGTIRNDDAPADTAGNTLATALSLGAASSTAVTAEEWLSSTRDTQDYFSFTIAATRSVSIIASDLGTDIDLQLFNASGAVIGTSYNTGTTEESITKSLAAGTYYVRAFAYSGEGDYTLSVTATAPAGASAADYQLG